MRTTYPRIVTPTILCRSRRNIEMSNNPDKLYACSKNQTFFELVSSTLRRLSVEKFLPPSIHTAQPNIEFLSAYLVASAKRLASIKFIVVQLIFNMLHQYFTTRMTTTTTKMMTTTTMTKGYKLKWREVQPNKGDETPSKNGRFIIVCRCFFGRAVVFVHVNVRREHLI